MMVWIGLGLVAVHPAAAQNVPTGTVELSGGSMSVGVGYTWGSGTLIFQSKEYPLTVHGISMTHLAMSNYIASGTVYNLTKPSDINGIYKTVSVEPAGSATTAFAIKNSSSVLIEMVSTQPGLNFNLGPNGLALALGTHSCRHRHARILSRLGISRRVRAIRGTASHCETTASRFTRFEKPRDNSVGVVGVNLGF